MASICDTIVYLRHDGLGQGVEEDLQHTYHHQLRAGDLTQHGAHCDQHGRHGKVALKHTGYAK